VGRSVAAPLACVGCLQSRRANQHITGMRSALLGRAESLDAEKGPAHFGV
jgi:hypothetical protein